MNITAKDRILFTGDSITDCGRIRADSSSLGSGYASLIAARLQLLTGATELQIFNRGIGGNRTDDVLARVGPDLIDLKPTVVSILLGINDVWRRYDGNDPTDAKTFEKNYRELLEKTVALKAKLILLEPFLLHVPADRFVWREDLNPKIDVVRKLAVEFGAELLPLDGIFAVAETRAPAAFWATDGVHPTAAGHALIAQAWLDQIRLS